MIEKKFTVPRGRFIVNELTDVLCSVFGESCSGNGFHHPGNFLEGDTPVDRETKIHPLSVGESIGVGKVTETPDGVRLTIFENPYEALLKAGEKKVNDYFASIGGNPID